MSSKQREPLLNPENGDFSDLDPAKAELAIDYMRIANNPAVRPLLDLDLAQDPALGQAHHYAQQFVLYRMFVQGVMGNRDDFSSQKVMDTEAANSTMQLTLRSINEFHSSFNAYTRAQGITGEQQAANIISGNINSNVTMAARDIATLYQQGLVASNGESANLQYTGRVLRFLNANLIFSDQLKQDGMVNTFYDEVYKVAVGEPPSSGYLNQMATNYAGQYTKPVTRGSIVQKLRRQAGTNVDDITNRAALMLLLANAKATLMFAQKVPNAREKYADALRGVGNADDLVPLSESIVKLMDRLQQAATLEQGQGVDNEFIEGIVQATQLNWEVLPAGELEDKARAIVDGQRQNGKEVTIDLERLNILANIRKEWGEDASYYVYGALGQRKVIKSDGKEEPDQYLLLILQDIDNQGNVRQEHAVAESPIAGPHALYVFRQDVSEGLSWREVMALPKSYARSLNARRLKHTLPRQAPQGYLVASMTEKVSTLMTCEPHEFSVIEFNGDRGFRVPKNILPQVNE